MTIQLNSFWKTVGKSSKYPSVAYFSFLFALWIVHSINKRNARFAFALNVNLLMRLFYILNNSQSLRFSCNFLPLNVKLIARWCLEAMFSILLSAHSWNVLNKSFPWKSASFWEYSKYPTDFFHETSVILIYLAFFSEWFIWC